MGTFGPTVVPRSADKKLLYGTDLVQEVYRGRGGEQEAISEYGQTDREPERGKRRPRYCCDVQSRQGWA